MLSSSLVTVQILQVTSLLKLQIALLTANVKDFSIIGHGAKTANAVYPMTL
jgi:hypothetical protein